MSIMKKDENSKKATPEKTTANPEKRKKCNGKRSNGSPCQHYAVEGGTKCKQRHSGAANQNAANPNYQGKSWSKDLPENLLDRIWFAWEFTNLFNNKDSIVYLQAELSKLAEQRDPDNGKEKWSEVIRLWNELRDIVYDNLDLLDNKRRSKIVKKLAQMNELMEYCKTNKELKKEIHSLINQHAAFVDQQSKIDVLEKQYAKVEQIALLFQVLYSGIEEILPNNNEMINSKEARNKLIAHLSFSFNLKPLQNEGNATKNEINLEEEYVERYDEISE